MVGSGLGGHPDAPFLGPAQHVHALRRRDVAHVQAGTGGLSQSDIAGDYHRFRHRRPAREPQPARDLTLVAARIGSGEGRILGVLCQHPVERFDPFEGAPHQAGVHHAVPVVGEHRDPGP